MKQSTFRILILIIFLAALLMGSAAISTSARAVDTINRFQSSGPGNWMFASGGTGNDGGAPGGADIFEGFRKFFDDVALPFLTGFIHR